MLNLFHASCLYQQANFVKFLADLLILDYISWAGPTVNFVLAMLLTISSLPGLGSCFLFLKMNKKSNW